MDDFGRGIGCLIYTLSALAASGWLAAAVLGALILAGVL